MRAFGWMLLAAAATVFGHAQDPQPDFRLPDVNMTSPRIGKAVSPRDYIMQVSGYYFGHAS